MQKVTLRLDKNEWEALLDFALEQHRPIQYQAEYIIRQALEQRGLLQSDPAPITALPAEDPKSNEGRAHVTD